ncbi:hypothetical protein [Rubrivirga marina]|uniref:Uncharacterized protein n=1 Tax=Rubrivirga marina TaxID=1196024 RepID=A0A271J1Q0_9BACT|nr:hypothetical protein [Rubrivirga marina]PAP77422.1 hypothetical protein BSZ37_13735 [Rubrivirga marina]
MTHRSLALLGVSTALALGCASTSPNVVPAFTFDLDGHRYGIALAESGAERANDLVLLEDGRLRLRVRDRDQDGRLDTLLVGAIRLEEADAIYAHGIAEARAAGAYKEREPARTFSVRHLYRTLVVWSVASGGSDWENRFVVYENARRGPVASDVDSDGTLDDHPELQDDYVRALEAARREGRIETLEDRVRISLLEERPRR